MKAVRIRGGRVRIERRPRPEATAGEALIRVSLAGICGTDLEIARGFMAFDGTPGHEFVGVVEDSAVRGWTGRRLPTVS